MDNGIKKFNEFKNSSSNTTLNEEGVMDYITGAISGLVDPLSDVLKGKVTAYLLSNLGITEQSIFSKLVQNFVEQIPVGDYFTILFQGKTNAGYLAPKAADATMEFLTEMGLDGIAEKLGVDKDGWIYRTIAEMFSNEIRRKNFREQLENFYLEAFNGFQPTNQEDFMKSLSGSEKQNIERALRADIASAPASGGSSNIVDDFISGIIGSSKNGPLPLGTTQGGYPTYNR